MKTPCVPVGLAVILGWAALSPGPHLWAAATGATSVPPGLSAPSVENPAKVASELKNISGFPTNRIQFPNATLNGKSLEVQLDTGSSSTVLNDFCIIRLGLTFIQGQPANTGFRIPNDSLTEPVVLAAGGRILKSRFVGISGYSGFDCLIGWPAMRDNNILVFDSAQHLVSQADHLPAELTGWIKLKLRRSDVLTLELPLPGGKTGAIIVDTGDAGGLALPSLIWKEWRGQHPNAPAHQVSYGMPGMGLVTAEEAWAEGIQIGDTKFTALPVREANPAEVSMADDFIAKLGLYALERLDFIVDVKGGFAYLRLKPPPGPPYPFIQPPGTVDSNAESAIPARNWTVADNVQINGNDLLASQAQFKALIKDFPGALEDYNQYLMLEPGAVPAYLERAVLKDSQHDSAGAMADFNRALSLEPRNAPALAGRSWVRNELGDFPGGIADSTAALALGPPTAREYVARGFARSAQGDWDGATLDFNQALKLDPANAPAMAYRGYVKFRKNDLDGALADLNVALSLDSKNLFALVERGAVKFQKQDLPGALADFGQAVDLDPAQVQARFGRASTKATLGDFEGAVADYLALIQANPAATYPRFFLSLSLRRLHRDEAPAGLAAAVKSWPEGWTKSVGRFLLGEITDVELLAAAAKGDPKAVAGQRCEAFYYLGMAHLQKGDTTAARDFFTQCRSTNMKTFTEFSLAGAELNCLDVAEKK